MTIEEKLRDSFESQFAEPPYEFSFLRYGEDDAWPGHYANYTVQCAWEGYLAGALAVVPGEFK
ncbi:hypothetical protein [Ferribacterium limneticum]|uniref:hypothetical protein n=1 Tax=Ferribacterium limneticum TaxID=76259 RepID=UPI001CF8536D|nr:hypothetical protein [Ferribacterium limneticum]UCV26770.1 hypothetical protein KI617_10655 [Ferribacterium limneticum]UCV30687.1 hypothetical protein KI608_10655 [Ferribacterium limneticum]